MFAQRRVAVRLVAALVGLLLIFWGLGELARTAAQTSDLTAVRKLAADRTASLTSAMRALSLVGSGYVVFPLTVVAAAGLFIAGRRGAAARIGLSTVGAVVIANTDKVLVNRPRPPLHHLQLVSGASFPSGHASQSAAFYGAVALLLMAVRTRRVAALLAVGALALLVGAIAVSRIYLAVHYPTDVAGGILLGAAWSVAVASAVQSPSVLARTTAASAATPTGSEPMRTPASKGAVAIATSPHRREEEPRAGEPEQPRIVRERTTVGPHGEQEQEVVDQYGRHFWSFRPSAAQRYDIWGVGWFWWLIFWAIIIGLVVWGWGSGWGY